MSIMWLSKGEKMKKIILTVCFLFIATSCFARDAKIYNRNYQYVGKVNLDTGRIYDSNYRYVGRIDKNSGNVYNRDYNRVGSVGSVLKGKK